MLNTWWAIPSCWATRRASSTSATEQQPESEGPPHSLRVAPTTSWPSRHQERRGHRGVHPARHGHQHPHGQHSATAPAARRHASSRADRAGHHRQGPVDVGRGGAVPEGEADGAAGLGAGHPHGPQHVAGLEGAAGAGGAGRGADPGLVEQHQQLLLVHPVEAQVAVARAAPAGGRRSRTAPGTARQQAVGQPVAQAGHPGRPRPPAGARPAAGPRPGPRRRPRRGCRSGAPAPGPRRRAAGRSGVPGADHERPGALGAAQLVGADRDQVAPGGRPATSSHGAACTASVCTTAAGAAAAPLGPPSASGWTVPTSLLASMTDTSTHRGVRARPRGASRSTAPSASTGASRSATGGAPCRPAGAAAAARHGSRTAACSTAEHTTVGRRRSVAARPARRSDAQHRQVVGLGAAAR